MCRKKEQKNNSVGIERLKKKMCRKKILHKKKCKNRTRGVEAVRVEDMLLKKKYRRKRCWTIA